MSGLYKPVRFAGFGRVFETDGHVNQIAGGRLGHVAERFLIRAANADVDRVAENSGASNTVKYGGPLDYRVREFIAATGDPVTLETDSTLYMNGREIGYMLRAWRSPDRIPAQAVVNYMLDTDYVENWRARADQYRAIPSDQTPATRPLKEGDCVHGYVVGPREVVLDAMSRHLAMALIDPELLRANVSEVPTEVHLS